MASFNEANQAKLSLKMKLHFYAFYNGAAVIIGSDGNFEVMIFVRGLDDKVRKTIPTVHLGVNVQVSNVK